MNKNLIKAADSWYWQAEQRAADYFKVLDSQLKKKTYVPVLTKVIQLWKQDHIHRQSLLNFFMGRREQPEAKDYHNYIKQLNRSGKLDNYLKRSVSYIYLRDLGKDLDKSQTQEKIQRTVVRLKQQLTTKQVKETDAFNIASLYRWAQKENVESTLIWLMDKFKGVSLHIPKGMDAGQAERKLIKIIAGVLMHVVEEMEEGITSQERTRRLDQAIRLGYSYGLTYPFIDDLLDANILTSNEKQRYTDLIRTSLITRIVPELDGWSGENAELMQYIHSELRAAFEYIKDHQLKDNVDHFFEQSYVFFQSQEVDRKKQLSYAHYTNEELYIPIILKSASSRLIVRSVISAKEDEEFSSRTFYYGIYNQLADDFTDMFDDLEAGAVTPYTYYLKYHDKRSDIINPYELYWTVISYLIHDVYHSDPKVCEVILDRAINSLKRCKKRIGIKKYNEVMELFASGNPEFNQQIQQLVRKADDVDFLDKLLRDHMLSNLQNERTERENFLHTIENVRGEINNILHIPKHNQDTSVEESIIEAANYSLEGDGKRLRPILTWLMGINGYGLSKSAIVPLLKSLEYMHTASLIFDDLPSQDNASTRRGRKTVHRVYDTSIAEITGLFLTQKAIEELTSLDQFEEKTVLRLVRYSAQVVMDMCRGQAMDLESKGKLLTLDQLETICYYKTGIAFEASLIMPAILAQAKEEEMLALKNFARHTGLAFQIKDDLLDVEGNQMKLGKPVKLDVKNNNATFVTVYGQEKAQKEMWKQYCLAVEALQKVPCNTVFLRHLLNYVVNRDH